jgi:hypothetical protein
MTRACVIGLVVVTLAGVASPVWAGEPALSASPGVEAGFQDGGRPAGPRAGGGTRGRRGGLAEIPAGATAAEVEQLFDRYVRAQARAALQLTPAQMPTFGQGLGRLLATRRQVQRERQRLLRELADLSRGSGAADDATVTQRLTALEEQRARGETAIRDAMAALDAGLTVPQRARFRVFERRMEQQRLDLLARARRAADERTTPASPEP